ncbi:recombinase family protein, partial [Vibrio splendidus]
VYGAFTEFLSGILDKLHALDLTRTLYPSKGRYQWRKLSLECGKTYWAPLDRAEFGEQGTAFSEFSLSVEDDFLQEYAQRTDYLSLMFNSPSSGDEQYDYPETMFLELACKFNFEEEREFSSTLQDNSFNRELYSSLDFLKS